MAIWKLFPIGLQINDHHLALTIQDILAINTLGIFSHTRHSKTFLKNQTGVRDEQYSQARVLRHLYDNPVQASKWSEDDSLVVKRTSNPKGQASKPGDLLTANHLPPFDIMISTTVTLDSIHGCRQTTNTWEISLNLRSDMAYRVTLAPAITDLYLPDNP